MEKKKTLYQVAIFGRTNVGKSTLFNRLTESNQALTSKTEGTTRDSNVGEVTWRGKKLELVDTGGVIDENSGKLFSRPPKNQESLEQKIQKQALNFIKNSDLIIFLVDVKTGLLPQDEQMAQYLKKIDKKNILLVVNKVDDIKYHPEIAEFNKLGLGN